MSTKWVYFFGADQTEGKAEMKNLLGGKGSNLAEMANLGIPVPPGFSITTEACIEYQKLNGAYPEGMWDQVLENVKKLETAMGAKFGSENPLLVSVRSGARVSMPGMMDTVLNLGMNDATAEAIAKKTGNPRFAYDSYRRFLTMFGDVVLELEHAEFEELLQKRKKAKGVDLDTELDVDDLKAVVEDFKALITKKTGAPFPEEPLEQLKHAINAVFGSWNNTRAIKYRQINNIPDNWGTAVNVQTMVYGNMGGGSGTGVAFTRDPATGEKKFFGEYLINAQGEDVVAGIRTPSEIVELKNVMPAVYDQLEGIYKKLEGHYRDMQDIEFTIQEGTLYMLQTRTGKRTAAAAIRIAVEMVEEGMISKETAVQRVEPAQLDQLLHPMIDPKAKVDVLAKGLPASPGAAVGKVVFTPEEAEKAAEHGEKVILVRPETTPEDVGGMHAAQGILTAIGGMTSHAAVVARGMGKCCIVGCGAIRINEAAGVFTVGSVKVKHGDYITLDGSKGEVIVGRAPLIKPEISGNFETLMTWADEIKTLGVWTNADTPRDASIARDFGAKGIGLCRTEHMFFAEDRIPIVRRMIMADDEDLRKTALSELLPMQRSDFKGILEVMQGLPVTIRLLDPPLHEFLPSVQHINAEMAELKMSMTKAGSLAEIDTLYRALKEKEDLLADVNALHEFNPMLGHRGCRLAVTFPEIYDMQVQAIFEAAVELKKQNVDARPEVMIPLVGTAKELAYLRERVVKIADEIIERECVELDYTVGTMIEVPRAALTASEVAEHAQFFSFGTNDLTQFTMGISRDDSGKFLQEYVAKGIWPEDPFVSIEPVGVKRIMQIAVEDGRAARPDLKIGICGEHGGEPKSIAICHNLGLNYVSCSPYRVPVARLAAAQAKLAAE
ncbi:pyruvate, phosphate dikinase [candidate division KSB3 bacterium]|uniref:Pyruvate, phosphate dikinase n=1 Tax=candidate division KSB3 bacterium TaxID=2044937 RepID=A0A2G6EAC2_9BACT|nr:MAG: pyruvate, phosphate dikinase [candidate division KSB3 bacterium]PIE30969.1 MAG: pyruvate, phosphate dikinase [candidate division KSB3 bacterium]